MQPPSGQGAGQALSNADFRKLLETPRRTPAGGETPGPAPAGGQSEGGGAEARKAKKKPQRGRPKPEAEAGEDTEPKYRDRAEERRRGLNADYEGVSADLGALAGPGGAPQAISVEDSKFLGGDLEHTHLVKGLDYALLQKVKGELAKTSEEEAAETRTRNRAARALAAAQCVTPLGRGVYNALFNPPARPDARDLFLPRRTAFVYELEEGGGLGDVPTTLRRSKADCPPVVDTLLGALDGAVLERLAKIMSYMRVTPSAQPGKRLKRKDKLAMLGALAPPAAPLSAAKPAGKAQAVEPAAPAAPAGKPADDGDDIFEGVGADYELQLPADGRAQRPAAAGKPGSYFNSKDDLRDLPPLPKADAAGTRADDDADMELDEGGVPPPPPPPPGGVPPPPPPLPSGAAPDGGYLQQSAAYQDEWGGASAAGPAPDADEAEEGAGPAGRRGADDDAYMECYPGYHDYATAVVDSDEEADFSHMDSKGGGKSRFDFETEEQWESYKSQKESLPKAAFQFGVKVGAGRKAHGSLAPGKAKDGKLNSQLHKIQRLIEEKGGADHSAAFAAPPKLSEDTGKPVHAKRRRI